MDSVGYTFEGAEASVELIIFHPKRGYRLPFCVFDYAAQLYHSHVGSASLFLETESRKRSDTERADTRRAYGFVNMWSESINSNNGRDGNNDGNGCRVNKGGRRATVRAIVMVRTPNLDATHVKYPYFIDTLEVSVGKGPIDNLSSALRKALLPRHPHLVNLEVLD